MIEILAMLAAKTSREEIVEELKKSCKEYQETPDEPELEKDEAFRRILMRAAMVNLHYEYHDKSLDEISSTMDMMKSSANMMKDLEDIEKESEL